MAIPIICAFVTCFTRFGQHVYAVGDSFLLDTIAAVVLGGTLLSGGVGGPLRTVFVVLVIVVLANGMTLLQVDPFFQTGIRGAVVILAVLITMQRGSADEVVK